MLTNHHDVIQIVHHYYTSLIYMTNHSGNQLLGCQPNGAQTMEKDLLPTPTLIALVKWGGRWIDQ